MKMDKLTSSAALRRFCIRDGVEVDERSVKSHFSCSDLLSTKVEKPC